MLLSSQTLWPIENSAVAHCWAMTHRLKPSDIKDKNGVGVIMKTSKLLL